MAKGKTSSQDTPAGPLPRGSHAPDGGAHYRVFVRDLVLQCIIGVHPHERHLAQRVRLNVDLTVEDTCASTADDVANVVSYEDVVEGVRALAARGRVRLVETLAEEVAALCLGDPRVASARVRVEKLDVFADAASVGIEIERRRQTMAPSAGEKVAARDSDVAEDS